MSWSPSTLAALCLWLVLGGCTGPLGARSGPSATPESTGESTAVLLREVTETERAFARTMAERNFAGFTALLADEAIFFARDRVLRGKAEVSGAWKPYFEGKTAPFSWEPTAVEVLPSGTLAHSSGPVRAPDGKLIATFSSVWRREASHVWRIVFDKGTPVCPPAVK